MVDQIQVDLTGSGAIDTETGEPLTGTFIKPIGYTELVMSGASPIPLGTQNPTLRQLADAVATSLPNISTSTISGKLTNQGFQSAGGYLQFASGSLGFYVRVYFNTPADPVHKIEWQNRTKTINQETGEIDTNISEVEHIFTTIEKVYGIAVGKVSEFIAQYQVLSNI